MLLWNSCLPTHTYPDLFWSTAVVSMCSVMRVNNDISMQRVYSLLNTIWTIRMECQDYVATQSLQPGSFQHPSLQFLLCWGLCPSVLLLLKPKWLIPLPQTKFLHGSERMSGLLVSPTPMVLVHKYTSLCAVWGRAQLPLGHNEVKIALTCGNIPELCQKWN